MANDAPHYSVMKSADNDNGFHHLMKQSAESVMKRIESGELVIVPAKLTSQQHREVLMNAGDPFRSDDRFYRAVVQLFKVTLLVLLTLGVTTPAHAADTRCYRYPYDKKCHSTPYREQFKAQQKKHLEMLKRKYPKPVTPGIVVDPTKALGGPIKAKPTPR